MVEDHVDLLLVKHEKSVKCIQMDALSLTPSQDLSAILRVLGDSRSNSNIYIYIYAYTYIENIYVYTNMV